jgi:hypothetical protein
MNDQIEKLQARIAELEPYEAAIAALVADSGDGALIADLQCDRFALARRFRSVVRAKLNAQTVGE